MLSEQIKRLRKGKKYSQHQLADKLKVTQGAISQWENNLTIPGADQIVALANIFDITVDELLERDKPEPDDVWELREQLRRSPEMRMLFDAAGSASPEHLRAAAAMLKALEKTNEAD